MPKLTDTQLIVLSKAAGREDGAATLPPNLNKVAAAKVGMSLVVRELMAEVSSAANMPVWREDADGGKVSLVIARAGREAIGVEEATAPDDQDSSGGGSANEAPVTPVAGVLRAGSKQALVIDMLSKEEGATLDALVSATGWLPHTTRAALTGLRKRGFVIERSRLEPKGSSYRIVSDSKPAIAA